MFLACERGALLIYSVVVSAVLFGVAGLAIDFGRIYAVNTQMQSFADHVALAVASELDGESDAITRADRVAAGFSDPDGVASGAMLVKQSQFFAGGTALRIRPPVYLSSLPDDPPPSNASFPIGDLAGLVTTDPGDANYVVIVVVPETVNHILSSFLGLFDANYQASTQTNAVAVATLTEEICNFTPLMICNPWESPGGGGSVPEDGLIAGTQILAKTQGAGSSWAPGNFGFLSTADNAGEPHCSGAPGSAARKRCVFALNQPNSGCVGARVDTSPGEQISVFDGMNVRFDIWSPPFQNDKNTSYITPAPNTIKGQYPQNANQCSQVKHTDTEAPQLTKKLPQDPCFASGTCSFGRIGDKVTRTQLEAYWNDNHSGYNSDPANTPEALPGAIDTRYETYKHEIAIEKARRAAGDTFLDKLGNTTAYSPETGAPFCYGGPVTYNNLDVERRTLIMAVINCIQHDVKGSATDVPVLNYLKMFMTEPATPSGVDGANLWLEVVSRVEAGTVDGTLHVYPVLVR